MSTSQKPSEKKTTISTSDLLLALLVPTLLGKILIVYFGLNYSRYPDEGYGYGLAAAISFTVLNAARFLWRNRNYED